MNRHSYLGSLARPALLPLAAYVPALSGGYGQLPLRVP